MLLFYTENGLTVKELFLFQSIFYLVSILIELPVGYFSDFISKKYSLLTSYLFFISTMLLWIFFSGYWIILTGEILLAISKVIMDNTHSGYLYDYLDSKDKKSAMPASYGYLNFALAAGTTLAAIIGTYLYSTFGSKSNLYSEVVISIVCIVLILSLPNVYTPHKRENKLKKLLKVTKAICNNNSIMYYIYYSGFLTSLSVMFALSFQPALLKAACPIALFGVAAFCNHGIRAVFSALTSKINKHIRIRSMIIPLFVLYLIAFGCIFIMLHCKNPVIMMSMILIVCLIIGFQLMFTIRQVSRLHNFVSSESRGTIVSVNNLFSRFITFLVLFTSKFCIDKLGFEQYVLIIFIIFIPVGIILMNKTYKIEEKI